MECTYRAHDIAYQEYSDPVRRNIADSELINKSSEWMRALNSSLGEKSADWAVINIIKAK